MRPKILLLDEPHPKARAIMEEVAECIPDSRLEHEDIPYQMIYTQLTPIETNVPVFCPCTGIDHVKAPKVIYLDEHWKQNEGQQVTSTAEHTMGLLLRLAKKLKIQLSGKTIGIIGMGRIGSMMYNYAKAFGMKIIIYDLSYDYNLSNSCIFEELLQESDVITIHVPLYKDTINMIGWDELKIVKSTCFLVNTSRQAVVNIEAVKWSLQNNKISGYADDFKDETDLTKYGAIQTNHVAGNSIEARQMTDEYIAKKVVQYIKDMV
jgi:phosphoglycerate dehydrogenase-like enzyme